MLSQTEQALDAASANATKSLYNDFKAGNQTRTGIKALIEEAKRKENKKLAD